MKEFQQLDSQNFHISPTVNYDWAGAMDIPAPEYDPQTERARWDAELSVWEIKTKEEWEIERELDFLDKVRLEQEASQVET